MSGIQKKILLMSNPSLPGDYIIVKFEEQIIGTKKCSDNKIFKVNISTKASVTLSEFLWAIGLPAMKNTDSRGLSHRCYHSQLHLSPRLEVEHVQLSSLIAPNFRHHCYEKSGFAECDHLLAMSEQPCIRVCPFNQSAGTGKVFSKKSSTYHFVRSKIHENIGRK